MAKSKPPAKAAFVPFIERIFERRRQNLLWLITAYGGTRRFCTAIQRDGTQISAIVTETDWARNPCGEKLARGIEEIVGLPVLWMDQDWGAGPPLPKYARLEPGFGGETARPEIDWALVPGGPHEGKSGKKAKDPRKLI